jgi:hypothetical protein
MSIHPEKLHEYEINSIPTFVVWLFHSGRQQWGEGRFFEYFIQLFECPTITVKN